MKGLEGEIEIRPIDNLLINGSVGYSTFNGRITYHNEKNEFDMSLGATNLFNKFYYRNLFVYTDIGNANINGQPTPPHEWYLTVAKSF